MSVRVSEWRIRLDPIGPGDAGGTLEVLRGDRQDAAASVQLWADLIEQYGRVPEGLDWRNESGAAVIARASALRYKVRVDCFERETETGTTSGLGWLYAVEEPC